MTRTSAPNPHPLRRYVASCLAGLLTGLLCLVALPTGLAQAAPAWPNVAQGVHGANVMVIQHLVTAQGHSTAADGIFGANTWSQLIITVRQGDSGSAVQAAQVALNKHGHGLDTDGVFGPATTAAAVAFQDANGLAADGIVGVAKSHDIPEHGRVIALAAAMQESRIQNIDYGDRDSQGPFQQRPSQGWGTVEEITTPVLATRAFYGVAAHTPNPGLLDIAGWESMSVAQAADAVQRSCCPNAYAQWETLARDIVAHETANSPAL